MKRLFLFIALIFILTAVHAQDVVALQKSLDSLKQLEISYNQRLLEIKIKSDRIKRLIDEKQLAVTGGDIYICRVKTTMRAILLKRTSLPYYLLTAGLRS